MNMDLTFQEVKSNISSQATKILHDLATVYLQGSLDDPKQAVAFCGLLACICEGKVRGFVDEESGVIKWSLTPEYSSELELLRQAMMESAKAAPNVVPGPWS